MSVDLAVVEPTHRHGELVADLSSESTRLGKAQVMRVRRCATAHEARLGRDEPAVILVAQAYGLCGDATTAGVGVVGGICSLRVGLRLGGFLSILVEL